MYVVDRLCTLSKICPLHSPYPIEKHRCADVFTLIFASHETTALSLTWIIIEVSRHPEVRRKVQEELDAVNPDPLCPFDSSHMDRVTYLDQVINEGMRLWPVAGTGSIRSALIDYEYGGYVLPKGCTIMIPFFALFLSGIQVGTTTLYFTCTNFCFFILGSG